MLRNPHMFWGGKVCYLHPPHLKAHLRQRETSDQRDVGDVEHCWFIAVYCYPFNGFIMGQMMDLFFWQTNPQKVWHMNHIWPSHERKKNTPKNFDHTKIPHIFFTPRGLRTARPARLRHCQCWHSESLGTCACFGVSLTMEAFSGGFTK